ncbi:MAG: hypothetical protein KKA62_00745 [Nanoarchaeota archaeon]|nr:hypothetical protein [Nanoarchaeota archaeon]MBU1644126.1 hypothetical protein [Nanoarchaeota archaeon]MBU1976462.1 hypothetical protein [Nanoarchaeota archaeon]
MKEPILKKDLVRLIEIYNSPDENSYKSSAPIDALEVLFILERKRPQLYEEILKKARDEESALVKMYGQVIQAEHFFSWKRRYMCNEVLIREEEGLFVYVGEAKTLHLSKGILEGLAVLGKYKGLEKPTQRRMLIRKFPPKWEKKEFSFGKGEKLWKVDSDEFPPIYSWFVSSGELSPYFNYRRDLKKMASDKGIKFSNEILNKVFGPIDTELIRIWRDLEL